MSEPFGRASDSPHFRCIVPPPLNIKDKNIRFMPPLSTPFPQILSFFPGSGSAARPRRRRGYNTSMPPFHRTPQPSSQRRPQTHSHAPRLTYFDTGVEITSVHIPSEFTGLNAYNGVQLEIMAPRATRIDTSLVLPPIRPRRQRRKGCVAGI